MNPIREVTKYGGLQTRKQKSGTILRWKKEYFFQAERWVALCVHHEQIPLLEWYPTPNEISSHQPLKVLDLFECKYVKIDYKDGRCFNISFVDKNRPPIVFAARNPEEAREWVKDIKKCLRGLNCLPQPTNKYQSLPILWRSNELKYYSFIPVIIVADSPPPLPTSSPPSLPLKPEPLQLQQPDQQLQEQNLEASSSIKSPSDEAKINELLQNSKNSTPLSPPEAESKPRKKRSKKNFVPYTGELPPRLPPRRSTLFSGIYE